MKQEYDFSKGKRGAVIHPAGKKVRITIRLDEDIVDWFKRKAHDAGGGSYQTMINAALREYSLLNREALQSALRTVIREELARYES